MEYNTRRDERLEAFRKIFLILGSVTALYFFIIMLVNLN